LAECPSTGDPALEGPLDTAGEEGAVRWWKSDILFMDGTGFMGGSSSSESLDAGEALAD